MNKKLLALGLAAALSLSFSGQAFARNVAQPDATAFTQSTEKIVGNFVYKCPRYSMSVIDGTVREITDAAVAVNVKNWGYNKDVEYLWFSGMEGRDGKIKLQVGDNLKIFYEGISSDHGIDLDSPFRTYKFYNTNEDISDEFKAEFMNVGKELPPTYPVTRGEMAKAITSYLYTDERVPSFEENHFSDIARTGAEWKKSVEYLLWKGIISESADGRFRANDSITYEEALVMILNCNMNDKLKEEIAVEGGFPNGYMVCAAKYIGADKERLGTRVYKTDVVNLLFATYNIDEAFRVGAGNLRKPAIYLYPEKTTEVSVKLDTGKELDFTYPEYNNGWKVTAEPNGDLTSEGKAYSYLFWEGILPNFKPSLDTGFVVKKEDTVAFLQDSLSKMGLTPKEYNEFIVYWAPKLMENEYNKIYFAGKEYTDAAKLSITPTPDSILRVCMVYEKANAEDRTVSQEFVPFERKGFTVVEWGGTCLDEE